MVSKNKPVKIKPLMVGSIQQLEWEASRSLKNNNKATKNNS
jgi:hypothetical protein